MGRFLHKQKRLAHSTPPSRRSWDGRMDGKGFLQRFSFHRRMLYHKLHRLLWKKYKWGPSVFGLGATKEMICWFIQTCRHFLMSSTSSISLLFFTTSALDFIFQDQSNATTDPVLSFFVFTLLPNSGCTIWAKNETVYLVIRCYQGCEIGQPPITLVRRIATILHTVVFQ